ncbi:MAG: TonB-dependent receptor [Methylococcaceae bacterium]|nr:TonB-dependent receptor [Methylococcaceae bacterium]MDP3903545.1 TonB-dependent receptor [Methylococcaceae bacterium]
MKKSKSISSVPEQEAKSAPREVSAESADKSTLVKNKTVAPEKQPENDNSVFELGEMVVTAAPTGALQSRDVLSSVDIMNADKIENQNVLTSFDLLHRMPGVQITQFNQGANTGKFSFRGFNGEGYINGVKLLIDGIPSNTNDGNMPFIDALFPLDIESIEVVRGTNDPRYGLHAIAGNANINTYSGGNYVKGRVSYGSFDTHDIQSGLGYEKDGFSQNYAISYRATNGYRDHASSEKNSFSGKWSYTPEDGKYTAGLSARWSEADAQESGYLTYKEQLVSRTQSMPRNDSDKANRQVGQLSGHLDVNLTDDLFWTTKSYANTYDDSRFVKYYESFIQQERLTEELQYGAITSLTYRPVVSWLDDFSVETGFDFQQQENKSDRYRTIKTVRIPNRHIRDQEFDFLVYGGYLQAVIKPTKWLKITPGFRADRIDGDFVSHRASSGAAQFISAKANDYGTIWQPKIGAVITPIDGYSLYGNWGRTFQVDVGAGTYKGVPTAPNTPPSINEGWEIGFKAQPVKWAEGRVAYWRQDATNESSRDLLSADNSSIPVGATKRQGVDVETKFNPIEAVSVWATYSLQEAIVTKAPIGGASQYKVGNQVFNTPDYLFSAGIDYQITSALKSSLWTTGQGDYFANSANTGGEFGEYALLNLDLGYQLTKQVDLQFQVKNLADTEWEYVWYEGAPEPLFSPGDGRAFYGAVNVKFDI